MPTKNTEQNMHVFASVKEWEEIDVTGGDQTITINGGVAMAIFCEDDGCELTIDTQHSTNKITPVFKAGVVPWEVTKIYQTGTTLVGQCWALAW